MQIRFVTTNISKVREFQTILQVEVTQLPLHLPEIQALEVDEVVRSKAEQAYAQAGVPILVEDTGLTFSAWNGLPGALIKWFVDSVGSAGICEMLSSQKNRHAIAKCTLDLYDGKEHHLFSGMIQGNIAYEPRGQGGFGWDDIFIPDGYSQTFAEMTSEAKNSISMRKVALDKLQKFLASQMMVQSSSNEP
jgi:non-canonical purine NTP pyrophosphatase (RdgB/HAM1 family)